MQCSGCILSILPFIQHFTQKSARLIWEVRAEVPLILQLYPFLGRDNCHWATCSSSPAPLAKLCLELLSRTVVHDCMSFTRHTVLFLTHHGKHQLVSQYFVIYFRVLGMEKTINKTRYYYILSLANRIGRKKDKIKIQDDTKKHFELPYHPVVVSFVKLTCQVSVCGDTIV